jgi:ATP-dependent helicase IRC3
MSCITRNMLSLLQRSVCLSRCGALVSSSSSSHSAPWLQPCCNVKNDCVQRFYSSLNTAATESAPPDLKLNEALPLASRQPVLRDYQRECIAASLAAMARGVRRQAVSLPVGSGKTVVFSNLIPHIAPPRAGADRVLVLAHRAELLHQAAMRIRDANPALASAVLDGSAGNRKTRDHLLENADVLIASVALLGRVGSPLLAGLDPQTFKAIIIDEAHHASSATYLRILRHFDALRADSPVAVWGCSATLKRHDGIALGCAFDAITYERSVLDMIAAGYLCRPRAVQIRTTVDVSSVKSSLGDFNVSDLARALNTPQRNQLVVRSWAELTQQGPAPRKSTLVFGVDVQHALDLASEFRAAGVVAHVVHGKTSADERTGLVEEFRMQKFPVLVNCGIFTEGTDIPCIDCVLMARPTRSGVLFQQMAGRGLRLFPGKADCLLIDIVDNVGRNSIVTVPSLLGLKYDFNANGILILSTAKLILKGTMWCNFEKN